MQVGQLVRNDTNQAIALGQIVLQDAKWHMLTLTTLWDGTPGYAMLIDGQLAGVLNGNYTYLGGEPSPAVTSDLDLVLAQPSMAITDFQEGVRHTVRSELNPFGVTQMLSGRKLHLAQLMR